MATDERQLIMSEKHWKKRSSRLRKEGKSRQSILLDCQTHEGLEGKAATSLQRLRLQLLWYVMALVIFIVNFPLTQCNNNGESKFMGRLEGLYENRCWKCRHLSLSNFKKTFAFLWYVIPFRLPNR